MQMIKDIIGLVLSLSSSGNILALPLIDSAGTSHCFLPTDPVILILLILPVLNSFCYLYISPADPS